MGIVRKAKGDGVGPPRPISHGMLRSELDEPARLLPDFEALVVAAGVALLAYERGESSPEALATTLQALRIHGPDGAEWTLGASTGQWYRRFPAGDWAPALPPEAFDDGPVPEAASAPVAEDPFATPPSWEQEETWGHPGALDAIFDQPAVERDGWADELGLPRELFEDNA